MDLVIPFNVIIYIYEYYFLFTKCIASDDYKNEYHNFIHTGIAHALHVPTILH